LLGQRKKEKKGGGSACINSVQEGQPWLAFFSSSINKIKEVGKAIVWKTFIIVV